MGRTCKHSIRGEARRSQNKVRGLRRATCEPKWQRSQNPEQTEGHGACADRARGTGKDSGSPHASGSRLHRQTAAQGATTSLSATAAAKYLMRVSVFTPNSEKKRAELREQDKASESK